MDSPLCPACAQSSAQHQQPARGNPRGVRQLKWPTLQANWDLPVQTEPAESSHSPSDCPRCQPHLLCPECCALHSVSS